MMHTHFALAILSRYRKDTSRQFHQRHRGIAILEALIAAVVLAIVMIGAIPAYQSTLASSGEYRANALSISMAETAISSLRAYVSQGEVGGKPVHNLDNETGVLFQNAVTQFATQLQDEMNNAKTPPFSMFTKTDNRRIDITVSPYSLDRMAVPVKIRVAWNGIRDRKTAEREFVMDYWVAQKK